ncbi:MULTISPECIES: GAF domain-containing sensor histidine kinase [unclassified Rhodococcus (in: high G+C Gram-positive bacteria)]|uniref:sensor histidine kinase n=1 Tax=unclassified Rhodococcus (in: high G+C Gram-positive bacteria) TaxID=192944 RepID=UPI0016397FBF|nr:MULTISPECIES: GAF domain-containing protein [unclassified Rhodococcus (in: high G+C Gram-positive bacteria)]MBC2639642.1 GAF domain-containing protein [Rhodococcus sp. 3A]MBC2895612.1 GAF domain-containing protein [Rhodococcus sp. 4CII]
MGSDGGRGARFSEFREGLADVVPTRRSLQRLFEAVLVVGSGLELDSTLQRIVNSATSLLDARYGALGVHAPDGGLSEFVYEGITPDERAHMGHLPEGRGLLGLLIHNPRPVRLANLADHPGSIGFPPNHPPMKSFLGMPIMMRDKVFGSIYLTEKLSGPEFTDEDEVILRALATSAGVAVENARLFEESRTRERWLTAVASITSRLMVGGSLDETLHTLAEQVRELSSGENVSIVVTLGEGAVVGADMTSRPLRNEFRRATRIAPLAEVLHSRTPALLTGLDGLAPFSADAGRAAVLPLSTASGVGGALVVTARGNAPWDPDEVARLESVADLAAVAVEFSDQQSKQRLLSVLADRDRIARDLHDNVIQRLFATGMSLQSTHAVGDVPDGVRSIVATAVEQLDRTVREIRTTIFDLHATGVASATSLRRRLLDVIGDLTSQSPIVPNVQFSGAIDTLVPARIHPHAEAVLREALSNALRHARATTIDISVAADDDLTVTVADDGIGIADGARRSGLDNLDRRAEQCGGTCTVDAVDVGTVVSWRVPLT